MFRGIGCPFAQLPREIAPKVIAGSGKIIAVSSSTGGCTPGQIGLGNVEVTFFVPHPTKKSAEASMKVRLAVAFFEGSICICSLLVCAIRCVDISVSTSGVFCLQKQRIAVLKLGEYEGIIGCKKVY
jgi:hypothetical protein